MSYSWGSDDSSPRDSGDGYSYSSARGAYDAGPSGSSSSSSSSGSSYDSYNDWSSPSVRASAGRSARSSSTKVKYPLNKKLKTESPTPLVVAVDVTGSMSDWPRLIFDKLPLLYTEVKRYLPEVEISFAAIGDAYSDKYPIQVQDFEKEKALDDKIKELYPEGGGGGGARESYELTAHFYATNCEMPKAKKPLFIFAGDEGFYTNLEAKTIKNYIGGSPKGNLDGKTTMKELAGKFDTYLLHKYYGSEDDKIVSQWKDALGDQRVLKLEDPNRIVDCIIGIVASSAGEFMDFTKRLTKRQTDEQVKTVMSTLHKISESPSTSAVTKTTKDSKAMKSKRLDS